MNTTRVLPLHLLFVIGLIACAQAPVAFGHDEVGFPSSDFEIDDDANLKVDHPDADPMLPPFDWNTVDEVFSEEEFSGTNDDSFGQGSKEDTPVPTPTTGSIPPNKSDLVRFGLYRENTGLNGRFLHLYWIRVQDPSGTTNMDFEFNQSNEIIDGAATPPRRNFDMLIQYDLENGGTEPRLFVSFWYNGDSGETAADCEAASKLPCWGQKVDLTDADLARGSINSTFIPATESDGLGPLDPRTFGEATIDFGQLVDILGDDCINIGSAYLKSRSSNAFASSLKDFIAPITVEFSNCASITINKKDEADHALGAGIQFSLFENFEPFDGGYNGMEEDGTTAVTDCLTNLDGVCTMINVFPGHYWLVETEATVPAGHEPADPVPVFIDGPGDNKVLTIPNPRLPKLRLIKDVVPDSDTGTFDLSDSVEGLKVDEGGDGADSTFFYTTTGSHTVSEAGGTDGDGTDLAADYLSQVECGSKGSNLSGTSHTFDLAYGDEVTCTFTNTRKGTLIVKKLAPTYGTNDDDFDFAGEDGFTFSATLGDGEESTGLGVVPGTYKVSESEKSGWELTLISCDDGGSDVASTFDVEKRTVTFEVEAGETVTCTFANTPLTTIEVKVDSLVDGGTNSTIVCIPPGSPEGVAALADDPTVTLRPQKPGEYVCTVKIYDEVPPP